MSAPGRSDSLVPQRDGAEGSSMTSLQPRTLVVIVNYRVGPLVVECLRSLEAEVLAADGERLADVVVVENDSKDDSAAVIRAGIDRHGWGGWARVIESPLNGGFAYGNNVALRDAKERGVTYDQVWLLNPDTVVRRGSLRALVEHLAAYPRAGIVGSSIEEDEHGTRWPYAFRFPSVLGEFEGAVQFGPVTKLLKAWSVVKRMGDDPERSQWLSGCSFMIRQKVIDAVGLMDEQFFLYYEEVDFCRRAVEAGWECWYVPTSRVFHISGRSTGVSGEGASQRRMPAYWFESRRRYFVKHHGRAYTMLADACWIVGFAAWRVRRRVQGKPDRDPPHYLADFIRHSAIFHGGMPGNSRLVMTAAGAGAA